MTFKDALDHALRSTGLSLRSVAAKASVSYEQLKSLRQGKAVSTNAEDAMSVAAAFGVSLEEFCNGQFAPTAPRVAVAGRVGAGAEVTLVDAYAKGDGLYHVSCPPQIGSTGIVAVEVQGDSMEPVYEQGDVLFYTRATHDGALSEDVGHKCIVADETGHVWVKQVKRGREPGRFHLISLNPGAQTVWDVQIKWAARVRFHVPSELVKRV